MNSNIARLERLGEFHRLLSINLRRVGVHQASKQATLARYAATQAWHGKEIPRKP